MIAFIARRLLLLPVIMLLVTLVLFVLMWQLPAEQRALIYLPSVNPHITEEEMAALIQKIIAQRGLDRPWPVQYASWLGGLLRGEWGYSPVWRQDVLQGLLQRAPATLELMIAAMIPALLLSLWLGPAAAARWRSPFDRLIRALASVGWAFPAFILALLLMSVFYAWLHWFAPERLSVWAKPLVNAPGFHAYTGMMTVDALLNGQPALFVDALRHLALPAMTVGVAQWALLTRVLRSSTLETLRQDYITTARAKGVSERIVLREHARRNAVLPLISTAGSAVSLLISGTVLAEIIFAFNGVSRAAAIAILSADVPVAVGFTLLCCLVTTLASLAADILYALADPRIRLERKGKLVE